MHSDRKRILALSLAVLFCLAGMAALSASSTETEVSVPVQSLLTASGGGNRHISVFSDDPVTPLFTDTDGFELAAETEALQLWLDRTKHTVRVLDRTGGYLWGTLPAESAEGLSKTWHSYGSALAALEYYTADGVEKRSGMAGNTEAVYRLIDNGFECDVTFSEPGISFTLVVTLENNRLSFSLLQESLREDNPEYLLKSVSFLPYLGAVYSDSTEGYLLIPDGSGALIRFAAPVNYTSAYQKKVYGPDLSIETVGVAADLQVFRPNDYLVEEAQVLLPVYGIVHGARQNGVLAVIDSGDEYATLTASPAMPSNPYNRASFRFDYRQKYVKNINRKEGAGANVPQEARNVLSPAQSFYFLSGDAAHYDGMAVFIRERLREQGKLPDAAPEAGSELSLRLEVLGGDKKNLFMDRSAQVFTTFAQAAEMAETLQASGIHSLELVLRCYTRGNEAGTALLPQLGSTSDLAVLEHTLQSGGGSLRLYLNPVEARSDQINLRTEAANNLSGLTISLLRRNNAVMYPETYFYRPNEMQKRLDAALSRDYAGVDTLFALDGLPNRLSGDYSTGREQTRTQVLALTLSALEAFGSSAMVTPNLYAWPYLSAFYDTPLVNSQLLYESDSVPFLPMVLSGSVELFGETINTGTPSRELLLRHIEYGLSPSFIATACDSMTLYKTAQEDYYSASFSDWEPAIVEVWAGISSALSPVRRQSILRHEAVAPGVACVTYSGGARLYVNYTDSIYIADDAEIAPMSWGYGRR